MSVVPGIPDLENVDLVGLLERIQYRRIRWNPPFQLNDVLLHKWAKQAELLELIEDYNPIEVYHLMPGIGQLPWLDMNRCPWCE